MNNEPNVKTNNLSNRLGRPPHSDIAPRHSARGLVLAAAALACAGLMALPARAALMAYEGFDYNVGTANLTGQNGGFGWNGGWQGVNNGASSVQSSGLTAGANAPSGYDAYSTGKGVVSPNNTRTGRL